MEKKSYLQQAMEAGDDHPYKTDFTLEDFKQMVKDLENDAIREAKRRKEQRDQSWEQILSIAGEDSKHTFRLDNGMFVTPEWCREYLKALDEWISN
jgi:hypothetical protein